MKDIDIIIPCYGSRNTIRPVVEGIFKALDSLYNTRIILANDCSPDGVWDEITDLCKDNQHITGINLSRNFGQQAARMAAMEYVQGEYVVFMDDDGQHDSDFIPAMINKIDEGFDIVYADFEEKKQAKWKTFGSNFHQLTSEWLEEKPKGVHTSSFFVVKRYLVEELKKYPSPSPVIFGYLMKMTQNITSIPVPHKTRINGRSGYTLKKLIKLWLNAVTSFSVVPLRVSSYLGFLSAGIGIVALIIIVIRKLLHPEIAAGYTSTIAVILLFAGILLLMMGLVGEYIGGMFMTVNHVPQYVIKEVVGDKKKGDKKCMKI